MREFPFERDEWLEAIARDDRRDERRMRESRGAIGVAEARLEGMEESHPAIDTLPQLPVSCKC